MLVNKNKTKTNTKKIGKDAIYLDDNVQAMRSWVRKLEQTTNSIGSRLSAVEKRISTSRMSPNNKNSISGVTIIEGPIEKVISELKENGKNDENLEYVFGVVDSELSLLQDEIETHQAELKIIAENIQDINKSLNDVNEEIKKTKDIETKFLTDFNERLGKVERRAPPVMKIGKIEVPIEISGIIAGAIALIAAYFVTIEQTSFLISPLFLGIVGIVFIASAVLKSIRAKSA